MKTNFKTLLLATAASGLLLATAPASFAASETTQALGAAVSSSMKELGIKSFNLKTLTYDQLLQIENIVTSGGSSADQKAAIEVVLSASKVAKEDAQLSKDVPSSAGLRESVVAGANENGIKIANPGNLTVSQLEAIDTILQSGDHGVDKKFEIEGVLGEAHQVKVEAAHDTKAMRASLVEEAKLLGVTISEPGKLTVDQVDQLSSIFNTPDKASDKKMAIENVLSSN